LITAFAQYYDPPVRAFTFQDFQLVPTLEEFEQILDYPWRGSLRTNKLSIMLLFRLYLG